MGLIAYLCHITAGSIVSCMFNRSLIPSLAKYLESYTTEKGRNKTHDCSNNFYSLKHVSSSLAICSLCFRSQSGCGVCSTVSNRLSTWLTTMLCMCNFLTAFSSFTAASAENTNFGSCLQFFSIFFSKSVVVELSLFFNNSVASSNPVHFSSTMSISKTKNKHTFVKTAFKDITKAKNTLEEHLKTWKILHLIGSLFNVHQAFIAHTMKINNYMKQVYQYQTPIFNVYPIPTKSNSPVIIYTYTKIVSNLKISL